MGRFEFMECMMLMCMLFMWSLNEAEFPPFPPFPVPRGGGFGLWGVSLTPERGTSRLVVPLLSDSSEFARLNIPLVQRRTSSFRRVHIRGLNQVQHALPRKTLLFFYDLHFSGRPKSHWAQWVQLSPGVCTGEFTMSHRKRKDTSLVDPTANCHRWDFLTPPPWPSQC